MNLPGFWMHETSGVLRPAVEAYLAGGELSAAHVAALRAYLRQWIAAPWAGGAHIEELRAGIDGLASRGAIQAWLDHAFAAGIDPL